LGVVAKFEHRVFLAVEPDGEPCVIDAQEGIGRKSRRRRKRPYRDYKSAGRMVHDDELW
jgi:hypothetical protein